MWKPQIKDAEKITPSAYKIIYEQGLQRFEECASESESITNKSIKLLLGVLTLGTFATGFCIQHSIKPNLIAIIVVSLLYVWEISILFQLMSPRNVYHRGIGPKEFFPKDLDKDLPENQESLVYYDAICMTEQRISDFYSILRKRTKKYRKGIIISFLLLITIVGVVLYTIYHP